MADLLEIAHAGKPVTSVDPAPSIAAIERPTRAAR
jgi:hypothetical protein